MDLTGFSTEIKEVLVKINRLTPVDILMACELTWLFAEVEEEDVYEIKLRASEAIFNGFKPVTEIENTLAHRWKKISFGCSNLDELTRGGIPIRGITEIHGAAGAGKTQICLQLCHTAQLPESHHGLGRGVVYISTEGPFVVKRFLQMTNAFKKRYEAIKDEVNFEDLFSVDFTEVKDVLECVKTTIPNLIKYRPVGLIVLDSVGALFRTENTSYIERAREMRILVQCLQDLAQKCGCAIVSVNQVASVVGTEMEVPCLGLAWSNLVTTRICVKREDADNPKRTMKIVFSSELPEGSSDFIITENGVENNSE